MKYNQNYKLNQITESTLIIGVDIAKKKHFARAFDWRGIELDKVIGFKSNKSGFSTFTEWVKEVAARNKKDNIIVGIEPTGHYWLTFAEAVEQAKMKLVQVNPYHVKRTNELDDNTNSKNDLKDPKTIGMLVKDGRYLIPYVPKGIYAELRKAFEIRERQITNKWRIKNSVARWLDMYFPEFKKVFSSWEGKVALLTLQEFGLPSKIVSLGAIKVLSTWRTKVKRAVGIKRAELLVEIAKSSVGITQGLEMAEIELQYIVEEYKSIQSKLEIIEGKIENLALQIPRIEKILSIKGIGIMTAAGFMAEVGDINRFSNAKQIIKLAGLNLRQNSSGQHKGKTSISKRGRSRLRAILFRVILPMVAKNKEFKELHLYNTTRINNPLKKKQSLVALCGKLIRIFYGLIKNNVNYDPIKLVEDIHREDRVLAA